MHLLETFCPERVRELISCSRRPELMRYSDITSTSELASGLTSGPLITPPWHRGALINIITTRDILAHKLILLLAVYSCCCHDKALWRRGTNLCLSHSIMCPRIILCFMWWQNASGNRISNSHSVTSELNLLTRSSSKLFALGSTRCNALRDIAALFADLDSQHSGLGWLRTSGAGVSSVRAESCDETERGEEWGLCTSPEVRSETPRYST